MKDRTRLAILGAAALVLILVTTLWQWADRSYSRLKSDGVIRIGYAVEAPYAFIDAAGNVTGESPEIARHVVEALGIGNIEWKQYEFDELIQAIETGQVDVIAAGMFITPERAQRISFSEPTIHVQQGLMVAAGNPNGLHSYEDLLSHAEITVAVLSGSIEEGLLRGLGLPDGQILRVPDALTGRIAVETGRAAGLALSAPTIQWLTLQADTGPVEVATPFTQPVQPAGSRSGYAAYGFRMQDRRLLKAWNQALSTYIGAPAHLELIATFGLTPDDLPGGITTQEILAP